MKDIISLITGEDLGKATFKKKEKKYRNCDVWKIEKEGGGPFLFQLNGVTNYGARAEFDLEKQLWKPRTMYLPVIPPFNKKVMRELAKKLWENFKNQGLKGRFPTPLNLSPPVFNEEIHLSFLFSGEIFTKVRIDGEEVRNVTIKTFRDRQFEGNLVVQLEIIKIRPQTKRQKTAKLVLKVVEIDFLEIPDREGEEILVGSGTDEEIIDEYGIPLF